MAYVIDSVDVDTRDHQALLRERERIAKELQLHALRLLDGVGVELQGIGGWVKDPDVIEWLENLAEQVDRGTSDLRRLAVDLARAGG